MIKLYYYKMHNKSIFGNFGDVLSKYIVEKISNKRVVHIELTKKWVHKFKIKHYFGIGSILGMSNKYTTVWGSGIMHIHEKVAATDFRAVRGPKTRKKLIELGNNVPEIYGDPALLSSMFFLPENIKKIYEYGIIPHHVDYKGIKNNLNNNNNILIINLECSSVEDVLLQVLQCKKIISSSLHGVIVPHAYNIPAIWLKYGDKLSGDDIKFYDYYESVKIEYPEPMYFDYASEEKIKAIFNNLKMVSLPNKNVLINLKKGLIESCPFISKKRKEKMKLLLIKMS